VPSPRVLSLLVPAVILDTLLRFVGIGLAPALLTHQPLLLIALSPLDRHLVVAATVTSMLPFVVVASTRKMLTCALAYGFGRAYGDEGVTSAQARYPRVGGLLRAIERLVRRAAPIVLFVAPWPIFCAMAGVTRMRPWLFATTATAGQVLWMLLAYRVGHALSPWIGPIMVFVRAHVTSATLGCLVLVVVYAVLHRQQRRRTPSMPAGTRPVQPSETVQAEAKSDG
jgi:membrane protein DedA with SNARE-associated domain